MPQPSVFISYSHEDKPVARILATGLEHRGCRVWIDEGELKAGDSVIERISEAVGATEFLVALISERSVGSRWCQREIALALTGELDGDDIPKVLPVRIGAVKMPDTIRDKLYRSVGTDRPELVVQTVFEDILGHHRRRHEVPADSEHELRGHALEDSLPAEPPRAQRAQPESEGVRGLLVGLLADGDIVRATELLRGERRRFIEAAREAIASAEADAPGPDIDVERFQQLEVELAQCLEQRLETLFPLVQYGPDAIIKSEFRFLATLQEANWGRSAGSYAKWANSPRWLVFVATLASGAVACAVERFSVVPLLWNVRTSMGEPLPVARLLAADRFAGALELARFGKRLRLSVFWHTAALMSRSDVCIESYYEITSGLESTLRQLSRFSWLCSALAGREAIEAAHWWTGVADLAGDSAGPGIAAWLLRNPDERRMVCNEVFAMEGTEDDVRQLDEWARTAPGPRF